jgi:hypothetical protein
MDRETVGWMLVSAGAVIFLFSALADAIGIGEGSFGWKQILGVILGAGVVAIGAALVYLQRREASTGARPIETVGTSTAGSVGVAPRSTEQQGPDA